MKEKTLIIVTLLFMLIVGLLLFFTVLEIKQGETPSIKIGSITSSTVEDIPAQPVYEKNTDFVKIKSCGN